MRLKTFLLLFSILTISASADQVDVIIRNGRLLDGSGNPWIYADVAVRGDRIVAVGDLDDYIAEKEIDAEGLYVAPGFIDTHSHASEGLSRESTSPAHSLLAQGLTTVFINPDGGGLVDLAVQKDNLLEHGIGVNVAQMIGHGSVRRAVLQLEDRAPEPDELERMKQLVRTAMQEGAFALSSGPFYAPGSYSDTAELVELAKVAAEFGGAYQSHIRDESDYNIGLLASVEEVITIAREAKLPGVITHIKALGPGVWGFSETVSKRIDEARAAGIEVWADQYPYIASSTSLASALLPRWSQAGGRDEQRARLLDPETRAKIREEMLANLARRAGSENLRFTGGRETAIGGKSLAEVAAERGEEPVDTAISLLLDSSPTLISFNMQEDDVERFMRQPWTMTASDGSLPEFGSGLPHPRGYGTFPRRIAVYTRERGVVDLAMAIRSMTHLPASVYKVADRGLIREGAYADIVVFDYDRITDKATFDDPHQLAEGVVHVFVNGQQAVASEKFTGTKAGRILRLKELENKE